MTRLFNFLTYNNAVPIAISIALLGAGGAFAATDPQAIYSSQEQVLSVDNSYIANKDLSTYSPKAQITSVTEDTDTYYVNYTLSTIDVQDYVWQDIARSDVIKVAKTELANGVDLGVYVTGQLKQIIDREQERLAEAQADAKKNLSSKTVSTTYGGLVGKFLDDTTETLPGYTPIVVPPVAQTAAADASQPSSISSTGASGGSTQLSLQLLGNNPAVIPLNTLYADLGVVLQDPGAPNLGYHTFVDGVEQVAPSIDTSTTTVHRIEYRATDQSGNVVIVRRIVLVGGAADPGGEISAAGSVSNTPQPTTSSAPAQQPQSSSPPPPSNNPPSPQPSTSVQTNTSATTTTTTATDTTPATTTSTTTTSATTTTTATTTSTTASSTSTSSSSSSTVASSTATSTSQ